MTKIVTLKFDVAAMDAVAATITKDGGGAPAAVWAVFAAVVSAAYAHGQRREHLFPGSVRGRAAHPAFVQLHEGKTKVARAFRATLAEYGQEISRPGRELTQQAHDGLLEKVQTFFMDACTPAPKGAPSAAETALDKALRLVHEAATSGGLQGAQLGILRSAFEGAAKHWGGELPAPAAPAPRPRRATAGA